MEPNNPVKNFLIFPQKNSRYPIRVSDIAIVGLQQGVFCCYPKGQQT